MYRRKSEKVTPLHYTDKRRKIFLLRLELEEVIKFQKIRKGQTSVLPPAHVAVIKISLKFNHWKYV
jgi:hypothetical protein